MSTTSEPRYFENTLKPLPLDEASLRRALVEFRAAIASSVQLIEKYAEETTDSDKHDSLYTGDSGIALMYLRLSQQLPALDLSPDFAKRLPALLLSHLPHLHHHSPSANRLSPVGGTAGPAVVDLMRQLLLPASTSDDPERWAKAFATTRQATKHALEPDPLSGGADEVLYGRAGLLWELLNLRRLVEAGKGEKEKLRALGGLVSKEALQELVDRIIEDGKRGKEKYEWENGEEGLPLMWEWHGKFYLGAMHGISGILTVLLQSPSAYLSSHLSLILSTISGLCQLSSASTSSGHLPSSLPLKSRAHGTLVQLCHGAPGLLVLLATLRTCQPTHWSTEEYGRVLQKSGWAVWEEGLVRKGLGVCHGVTGNAWSFLLLSTPPDPDPTLKDTSLSRALAFLLHATQLPPLSPRPPLPYRTPDHPLSLFEGLAGAVCAWADAAVVIEERLEAEAATRAPLLGLPGLGGNGPKGVL